MLINTVEKAWALRNSDRAAARSASEILLTSADADPRATALAKVVLSYLDYRERRYAPCSATWYCGTRIASQKNLTQRKGYASPKSGSPSKIVLFLDTK